MNQLIFGDNLQVLPTLAAKSIDLTITSPPYYLQRSYNGVSDGNEATFEQYLDNILGVFEQCWRVATDDGVVIINLGDKWIENSQQLLPYRVALAIMDKFKPLLVNDVTWHKPNGMPKLHMGKRLGNYTEQFFVFAKNKNYYFDPLPLTPERTFVQSKPTARLGQGYHKLIDESVHLTDAERVLAHQTVDHLIQDVHDGVIEAFRLKIRGEHALPYGGESGGPTKAINTVGFHVVRIYNNPIAKNIITHVTPNRRGSIHPAMYPVGLIEKFIGAFCRPKGMVLDPYMGSGSTGQAAINTGRYFTGIEVDPAYYTECRRTLDFWISDDV